jgi:hypothetical protein
MLNSCRRKKRFFLPLFLFLLSSGVFAAAPPEAQLEVMSLLKFVQESNCEFNRNNTWHNGKEARAHLEMKYDSLVKRNVVGKAEDFIEKAASKSSLSGQDYQIRCPDGKTIPSAQWLSEELSRFRGGTVKK